MDIVPLHFSLSSSSEGFVAHISAGDMYQPQQTDNVCSLSFSDPEAKGEESKASCDSKHTYFQNNVFSFLVSKHKLRSWKSLISNRLTSQVL